MYAFEFGLGVSEVPSETAHLINVGLLSGSELAEHVPIEDSF
jgi:hypothetical protein